jgi:hypothetical protein
MNLSRADSSEREAILSMVIEAANGLDETSERAFAEPIGPDTLLVRDLGCQSINIVCLAAALIRQLQCTDLSLERLFWPGERPASDISLRALADFLSERVPSREVQGE